MRKRKDLQTDRPETLSRDTRDPVRDGEDWRPDWLKAPASPAMATNPAEAREVDPGPGSHAGEPSEAQAFPWRRTLPRWSSEKRERWGLRANELAEAGVEWPEDERQAFEEILQVGRVVLGPASPVVPGDVVRTRTFWE